MAAKACTGLRHCHSQPVMAVIVSSSAASTQQFFLQGSKMMPIATVYIYIKRSPAGPHATSCTPLAETCLDPLRVQHAGRKSGKDVGGLQEMRMEGGARRVTQVRRREAMIASQHAAGNYNAIFPHSLSPYISYSLSHSHLHVLQAYVVNVTLGASC